MNITIYSCIMFLLAAFIYAGDSTHDLLVKSLDAKQWKVETVNGAIEIKYSTRVYIYNAVNLEHKMNGGASDIVEIQKQGLNLEDLVVRLIAVDLNDESYMALKQAVIVWNNENDRSGFKKNDSGFYMMGKLPIKCIDGKYYYVLSKVSPYSSVYPLDHAINYYQALSVLGVDGK